MKALSKSQLFVVVVLIAMALIGTIAYLVHRFNPFTILQTTAGEAIPISINNNNAVAFKGKNDVTCPVNIQAATGTGFTHVLMSPDSDTARTNYTPVGCSNHNGATWPCELSQGNNPTLVLHWRGMGTPSSFAIYSWEVKDFSNFSSTPDKQVPANYSP